MILFLEAYGWSHGKGETIFPLFPIEVVLRLWLMLTADDFCWAKEIVEDGMSLLCIEAYEFIRLVGDLENFPVGELSGDLFIVFYLIS